MKAKLRRAHAQAPKNSSRRFLTQADLREIRWGIAVANRVARQEGHIPLEPQITTFSCHCNCFHVKVD